VCDVYDRDALTAALAEARPDVVVNQLTDIPKVVDPRRYGEQMAGLGRIRTEGYANLAAASQAAGARRIVAQSISFIYRPAPGLAVEDDPLWLDVPEPMASTVRATAEGERTILDAGGLVLRFGWFYGPGTAYAADGGITAEVKRRRYPVVGSGGGVFSFIHVADAADATVAAVASDATGMLNVVDDEPVTLRDVLPSFAESLGARPPRRVPKFVARLAAGKFAAAFATEQRGASNARAKQALGWSPRTRPGATASAPKEGQS
jgi:nucleoside-diphosphate-sugar epimerase